MRNINRVFMTFSKQYARKWPLLAFLPQNAGLYTGLEC